MKVVIQRVNKSTVTVDNKIVGKIDKGLNVLVGFTDTDTMSDLEYLKRKILNLRIFDDENGIMNKSIKEINGEILLVSQFTLYADTKKGNRPSYIKALNGEKAVVLYNQFIEMLSTEIEVETGIFGANMQVEIENDGPITIIIDSKI